MKTLSLIFILFFYSCSGSKHLQATNKDKLAISFFSKGSGIDHKKKDELDKFIQDFQKTENATLSVEKFKWGKEGEIDYCVDLKTLSRNIQEKFIEGVKQLLSSSTRVKIREVDSCKH